jgi:transposase
VGARAVLDAILFRLRTGCQWNQLPARFPDASSVHRTFQRWARLGVFARIWAVLVERWWSAGGALR